MMLRRWNKILCKIVEMIFRIRSRITFYNRNSLLSQLEKVEDCPNQVEKTLVIIPFKDKSSMTINCITTFIETTTHLESVFLCLVNNRSSVDELEKVNTFIDSIKSTVSIDILNFDEEFNFSRICNYATLSIKESFRFVLILNNDILIHSHNLLWKMIGILKNGAGIVGCKLLYPDNRVQHLMISPGVKLVGAHPYKGLSLPNLSGSYKVAAVTGALMCFSKSLFNTVGGFDEAIPTHGQDLDFCLKAQVIGRDIVSILDCKVVHFESASRKSISASLDEVSYMYNKWNKVLTDNPLYPANLSRWCEQPIPRYESSGYPWWSFF